MKTLVSICFISFLLFSCSATKSGEPKNLKIWGKDNLLNWDDFRGLDDGSGYASVIHWEIKYKSIDSVRTMIYASMDRKKSWWLVPSTHVLRHEQYHFNIAEIFARKIRKLTVEQRLQIGSTDFQNMFFDLIRQGEQIQINYDFETKHSTDQSVQTQWEKWIDQQLNDLDAYANNVIDNPTPIKRL